MALGDWLHNLLLNLGVHPMHAATIAANTPAAPPLTVSGINQAIQNQNAAMGTGAGGLPPTFATPLGPNTGAPGNLSMQPLAGISPGMATPPLSAPVTSTLPAGAPPTAGAAPLWQPNPNAMANPLTVAQLLRGGRFPGMPGALAQAPPNPLAQFGLGTPQNVAGIGPMGG